MATIIPRTQCIVSNGILRALRDIQSINDMNKEDIQKLRLCLEYLTTEKSKNMYKTPAIVLDMELNILNYSLKEGADYVEFLNRSCAFHEHFWNKVTIELKACKCENKKHTLRYRMLMIQDKLDEIVEALRVILTCSNTFNTYVDKYLPNYNNLPYCMNPLLD